MENTMEEYVMKLKKDINALEAEVRKIKKEIVITSERPTEEDIEKILKLKRIRALLNNLRTNYAFAKRYINK
ncbi:hypothetical protein [Thermicanus aegyptius]|uniref:hypothetical protein n=1 Tax=Thermicanus aegyptius TaxID=94009 RepID=UPI000422A781|nr:hypothetical protein [Thermicanus aegyptius]